MVAFGRFIAADGCHFGKYCRRFLDTGVFNYTPFPWMYRFDYLKYLFIVIPGSIAGEYLMEWMKGRKDTEQPASPQYRKIGIALLILTMVIIVFNLYGLYTVCWQ